jgi:hypothetical protein
MKFDKEIAWRTAWIPAVMALAATGDATELRNLALAASAALAGYLFDRIVFETKQWLASRRPQGS